MVIPVYRKNTSELTGQRAVEPAGTSPSLCAPALSRAPLGSSLSPLWRPGMGRCLWRLVVVLPEVL